MIDHLETILRDGVMAPSGENCQPWRFEVESNVLSIFNVPEADTSLYNSLQKGSYLACGALLENITISAKHHGYKTELLLFPDDTNQDLVAKVVFIQQEIISQQLYESLAKRCTNRKDFSGEKLSLDEKEKLHHAVNETGFNSLVCVDETSKLNLLGKALALHEKILFENKSMHDFFYDHILWDKKDEYHKGGFYIKTLELLPHQLGAVKLFKKWWVLSLSNKFFRVANLISKDNGIKYAHSGTLAAITLQGSSPKDYVLLGQSVERMWLTATSLGLSVHPCNGTLYLREHLQDSGDAKFTKKHSTLIQSAYNSLFQNFGVEEGVIGFIVRIGKASEPSARAHRTSPKVLYKTA
jgi:nitroreductase